MNRLTLILGGARSGKSRFALEQGKKLGASKYYIATAQALDPEMARRIEMHRRERSSDWTTLEEPIQLTEALQSVKGKADLAVIDCLTLWLSNLLMATESGRWSAPSVGIYPASEASERGRLHPASPVEGATLAPIMDQIDQLVTVMTRLDLSVIAVSNEVGLGIIPADPLSRLFRDLAGVLHQRLARVSHEVYWMTAGLAVQIKGDRDAKTSNHP